jgi:hypothetical protein
MHRTARHFKCGSSAKTQYYINSGAGIAMAMNWTARVQFPVGKRRSFPFP